MPGNYLIAEEYRRLLWEFAAGFSPDYVPAGATTKAADYDPLRLRPVSDVTSCVEKLLGIATEVPLEWQLGQFLAAESADLLTTRALNSGTIGEGLQVMAQHQAVLTTVRSITLRSRSGGDQTETHHGENVQDSVMRFLFHSILAAKLSHIFHSYSGCGKQHRLDVRASSFGSLMKRFDRELQFVEVEFGESECTLGFRREILNHKISNRNDRLIKALDYELGRRAAELPTTGSWSDRIKFHIRSNHLSKVSLEDICDTFRVQRRTLARLLRDEGTTLTNILTDLRRDKALHLVRNTEVPLKRVAAELGFNSDASFNMAFKSWTGTTPMKFRKATPARPAANDVQPARLALAVEAKRGCRPGPLLNSWSHRNAN